MWHFERLCRAVEERGEISSLARNLKVESLEERCLLEGRLLITEISAANDNGIRDVDGDRSDWVEIHNAGDATVDLQGWYLTDDPGRLTKWRFPSVVVEPGDFQLVFASGKHRSSSEQQLHTNFKLSANGEYIGLVSPDGRTVVHDYTPSFPVIIDDYSFGLDHEILETTILASASSSQVHIPADESLGTRWTNIGFDAAAWIHGPTGVGFGRTDGFAELVRTEIRLDMLRAGNASAYIRVPFDLAPADNLSSLTLRMKYDDGFVAYLNGQAVARRNAPDDLEWNSEATQSNDNESAISYEDIDISTSISLLHTGVNVLAIHGLNLSRSDSDFLIVPELLASSPAEVDTTSRRFFATPSPERPNGAGAAMYIDKISHSPVEPRRDEALLVTAQVNSLIVEPVSVKLHYRVMFGEEVEQPMFDDGLHRDGSANDGTYGALIPSGVAEYGDMIRYYMTAEQGDGTPSRWPQFQDPFDTEQYLGTIVEDPTTDRSKLPLMHLFMKDPDAADTRSGTRASIFYAGEFYDNVRVDLHGRGSVSFPKKSHDIDFNRDHRFQVLADSQRVTDINLITNYSDRAMMRSTLVNEAFAAAGAGGHIAFPIRTQLNGNFHAIYDLIEDPGERFLERIGRDPNGALYKMLDPLQTVENGLKETRKTDDHSDLQSLIDGINLPPGPARTQFLYDNINLPELASFLAMLSIAVHSDCCFTNFYMYRDTNGTGEWEAFPFDVDNSMGNWVHQDGLRTHEPIFWNRGGGLFAALYDDPGFEQMYLRRLRTLMDENYGPRGTTGYFAKRLDELAELLAPDASLDNTRWAPWGSGPTDWRSQVSILRNDFLPTRAGFLYGQTAKVGGPIPDAQPLDIELQFGQIEASPESGDQDEEFIELINPNNFAVDLSGWSLEGDVGLQFKLGTVIPSGGSLYLSPNARAFRARSSGATGGRGLFVQDAYNGRLSSRGGTLKILDTTGRIACSAEFSGEPTPVEQFLRITEIMYNPTAVPSAGFDNGDDFEFIELYNTSDTNSIDLSNVTIAGGVEFDFSDAGNQDLEPGQFVLVVNDIVAFEARYGVGFFVAGEFDGRLSNGGEQIVLDEGGTALLDFVYRDDWYPSTDGMGPSLTIVDHFERRDQWNQRSHWRPSARTNGSPGTLDDRIAGDVNADGRFDSADLIQVFLAGEYEDDVTGNSTFEDGDWNGDGEFDSADLVFAFRLATFVAAARPTSVDIAATDSAFAGNGARRLVLPRVGRFSDRHLPFLAETAKP